MQESIQRVRQYISNGNCEGLKEFFKDINNADIINTRGLNGYTALRIAVNNSDVELVKLLLMHGADPNIASTHGNTPLHIVVKMKSENQVKIIELLLENGMEPVPSCHGRYMPVEIKNLLAKYVLRDISIEEQVRVMHAKPAISRDELIILKKISAYYLM